MGNLGAPNGSERNLEHSRELIMQGKVGFVTIPTDGHINFDQLSGKLRTEAIGLTPDKRYVIVDCSDMNATMGFVADQLVYERNATFSQGGQIHRGYLGQYGPKNVMDSKDLDMRSDDVKKSHQQLLLNCQHQMDQVTLF